MPLTRYAPNEPVTSDFAEAKIDRYATRLADLSEIELDFNVQKETYLTASHSSSFSAQRMSPHRNTRVVHMSIYNIFTWSSSIAASKSTGLAWIALSCDVAGWNIISSSQCSHIGNYFRSASKRRGNWINLFHICH